MNEGRSNTILLTVIGIATLLVVFTPLIVSVACLIKGLLVRKAHNKQ